MTHTRGDDESLEALHAGVWIRGAPGSGRSHHLEHLADAWAGPVLQLPGDRLPRASSWLEGLPDDVLICIEDAPPIDRAELAGRAVAVTGVRPGRGWQVVDLEPLPEDEGVQLFLRHAPLAQPRSVVEALVHRLGGHPTAIVAAARRWPCERLEAILLQPEPWPGLREVYDALSGPERDALALLSQLPGPARHEGLKGCGATSSVRDLVTMGWVTIDTPGQYRLAPALAQAVRPWRRGDLAPYLGWFLQEAHTRVMDWDTSEGAREWFRSGLWTLLWERHQELPPRGWFFLAWALSGEAPSILLGALELEEVRSALSPLVAARCAAHAHQSLGEHGNAARVLSECIEREGEPHHRALARMELGVAHHWLRNTSVAREHYVAAISQLSALGLHRARLLCTARVAMLDHSTNDHVAARRGYLDAIAGAQTMGYAPLCGYFSSNLGVLLLEADQLDEARRLCQQAIRDVSVGCDDRLLAMTYINQASVELLEGHLEAADRLHQDALGLLRAADPGMTALCHARRGAVAALRADPEAARSHHHRAADIAVEDPVKASEIALWQLFLEWTTGDRGRAMTRRSECFLGEAPLAERSDETRLVLRLLERLAAQAPATLLVEARGKWFRLPRNEPVEVSRYEAASRVLVGLARAAELRPGAFCSAADLIDAGWPDEQILPDAAKNRLSVTLARLRRLGLRDLIQRTRNGWRLDPDWRVLLLRGAHAELDPTAEGTLEFLEPHRVRRAKSAMIAHAS